MIKSLLISLINFYKKTEGLRSQIAQALHFPIHTHSCRFNPTCSDNMILQIREKGAIKGIWEGLKQIAKCHPFGRS